MKHSLPVIRLFSSILLIYQAEHTSINIIAEGRNAQKYVATKKMVLGK